VGEKALDVEQRSKFVEVSRLREYGFGVSAAEAR
jgi:hypothetical protein